MWVQTDDIQRRLSLVEDQIREESYAKYSALGQTTFKNLPSVQADVFSKGQYTFNITPSIEKNLTSNKSVTFADKGNHTMRDQFGIAVGGSYDVINTPLTELNKTSGTLAIALDEKEMIDKKTSEDPNINVSLKKTDSTLKIENINEKSNENTTICRKNVNNKSGVNLTTKETDNEIILNDLLQMYDANSKMDVNVLGENGSVTEIKATLTKTLSGNLAVDVYELALLVDMPTNEKRRGVVLKKNKTGFYDLDIRPINECPNAVIRKTASGGVLVVLTDPVLKSTTTGKLMLKEKLFKLKIKNRDEVNDPPAVLKSTPSHNYIFVVDKEYEKGYKNTINNAVEDNTECCINMSRTSSGNFMITFGDSDQISPKDSRPDFISNALLVKSPSGNMKILKKKSSEKLQSRRSSAESKVFSELLKKLPITSKEFRKESGQTSRISSVKSCSESNMYDMVKIFNPDRTNLLKQPLDALKKTNSGQYAVVLGKESKKDILNSLKSYLQNNSHGLIPVKRTESGEITVVLNGDQNEKTHYGSLKITPSGNIYVMVEKNLAKELAKETYSAKVNSIECSTDDTRSLHLIDKLKRPVNKAVSTSCNAQPDACCCEPSKCVCKELQCNAKDWSLPTKEKEESLKLFNPQMCGVDWGNVKRNPDGSFKVCDPKCLEKCCNLKKSSNYVNLNLKDNLTNVVIKPCTCKPVLHRNPHAEEQCYFVINAVNPNHKDRYDSVSNDLLEISDLCYKASESERFKNSKSIKVIPKTARNDNAFNWDSFHFLPPQLPAFLRE